MSGPLVSIVVPVYNVESYIEECLQSVCSQTYENLGKLFKNPCSQAELNKIVPFGFSLQRQKMVFFCH